jgi:hypothetical protein
MKPDPEQLRDLGENVTNVENAWAGATDYLSRGLKAWTRLTIGRDRALAVRAALAACELVIDKYTSDQEGLPPRKYLDDMVVAIKRWLEAPTRENTEAVRSSLDVTRSAHAWQRETDVAPFWILEAVDHTCLVVWSGERASYIVPMDFATCAARAVACVLHAMLDAGVPEAQAVGAIVDAVRGAAG